MNKISIIVPTYYGKNNILNKTVLYNCNLLRKVGFIFQYIVVVDFYSSFDSRFRYQHLFDVDNYIRVFFHLNESGHKESFKCANFGMAICLYDDFLLMDDDFLLSYDFLETVLKSNSGESIFLSSFQSNASDGSVSSCMVSIDPEIEGVTIGGGTPKVLNKKEIWEIGGFYNPSFVGYMFGDNESCRRLLNVKNKIFIDGDKFEIVHLSHDHFLNGEEIGLSELHKIYYEKNKKKFNECFHAEEV